jgi:hypothetical protein
MRARRLLHCNECFIQDLSLSSYGLQIKVYLLIDIRWFILFFSFSSDRYFVLESTDTCLQKNQYILKYSGACPLKTCYRIDYSLKN